VRRRDGPREEPLDRGKPRQTVVGGARNEASGRPQGLGRSTARATKSLEPTNARQHVQLGCGLYGLPKTLKRDDRPGMVDRGARMSRYGAVRAAGITPRNPSVPGRRVRRLRGARILGVPERGENTDGGRAWR